MSAAQFRDCLERCDVEGVKAIWAQVFPHLPLPKTDDLVLVAIHRARTQAESVRFALRAYSHRWLEERGLPSGLPDELKPKADRIYPVVIGAVGVAVKSQFPALANGVRSAMEHAVMDACDGRSEKLVTLDQSVVRSRMFEARDRVKRQFSDLLRG